VISEEAQEDEDENEDEDEKCANASRPQADISFGLIPCSNCTLLTLCPLAFVRNGNSSGGSGPCRGLFLLLPLLTTLLWVAAVEMLVVAGRGKTPKSHRSPPFTAASLVWCEPVL